MSELVVNNKLIDFLSKAPEELARFVKIITEFYKMQEDVVVPDSDGDGPRELTPGQEVVLTTIPITNEQLDSLMRGTADAVVKEKAVDFVKAFLAGAVLLK